MLRTPRIRGRRRARGTPNAPIRRSERLKRLQIDSSQPSPREISRSPLTGSRQRAQSHQFLIENAVLGLSTTQILLSPVNPNAGDECNNELPDDCNRRIDFSDSDDSEYDYSPLQEEEIRLLQISNTPQFSKSQFIQVKLIHQNLKHCIHYIAVSYAWGPPHRKHVVETDGGTMIFITSNLWDFLCAQSKELSGRMLWIDQICINQGDLSERAHQVRLMSRIFETASETILWLGNEDEDTEHAFKCIRRFESMSQEDIDILNAETLAYPLDNSLIDANVKPFHNLLARSWFSRLWALQEAILGTSPKFVCGTKSASWDDFTMAVLNLSAVSEIDFNNTIPMMYTLRNNWQESRQNSLLNLLFQTHLIFDCNDPRDKVYALLSMQSSLPDLQIDYNAEIEDVYISVAQALIRFSGSLELLGCVDTNNRFHPPGHTILPSWVPDWRGISLINPFSNECHFQACNDFVTLRHTEIASNSLEVHGRIIDCVYQAENPREVRVLTKGNQNRAAAEAYLRAIPGRIYHGIPETNYTLPKQFQALLVRTIMAGHYTPYSSRLQPLIYIAVEQMWSILTGDIADEVGDLNARGLWSDIGHTCHSRNIFALERYTIALGPPNTEPGDVICILHGSKLPIVLRRQDDKWRLVGQCYVDGVMFGEAVTWAEDEADTFELI